MHGDLSENKFMVTKMNILQNLTNCTDEVIQQQLFNHNLFNKIANYWHSDPWGELGFHSGQFIATFFRFFKDKYIIEYLDRSLPIIDLAMKYLMGEDNTSPSIISRFLNMLSRIFSLGQKSELRKHNNMEANVYVNYALTSPNVECFMVLQNHPSYPIY